MDKKRGKFLTIILVFMILSMVYALYLVNSMDFYKELYSNTPSWLPTFGLINSLIDIGALIGIWLWKKWAVYLYAVSVVLAILMEVLIFRPTEYGLNQCFTGILLDGLVFWAISRKWKAFA